MARFRYRIRRYDFKPWRGPYFGSRGVFRGVGFGRSWSWPLGFFNAAIPHVQLDLLGLKSGILAWMIFLPLYLVPVWMSIVAMAKRCHDRDKSAWWLLVALIPVVGQIWWLVELGCLRGTDGRNRFGIDPTQPALVRENLPI